MADLPPHIGNSGSFLTDRCLDQDTLRLIFQEGSFNINSVRHASYQLRLGNTVKVNVKNTSEQSDQVLETFQEVRWSQANGQSYIDIKPRQRALLYTEEKFNFPDNVIGFVICRGLLFSRGMTPGNTYVDPGFKGELYITIVNRNENSIRLCKGMPIARLFVFKLEESVNDTYVAGEHIGIEQQLAEIPVREYWPKHELKNVKDKKILESIMDGCSIGDLLNQIISRQRQYFITNRRWLTFLTGIFIIIIAWPIIWPLLAKIKLPDWFSEELFKVVLVTFFGAIFVAIIGLVKKIFYSISSKINK
jgi:deoxycytidine triphosphate deaminase